MSKQKYFWNNKPVKTDFGFVSISEDESNPSSWFNYECVTKESEFHSNVFCRHCAIIPAIRVTTADGKQFCIANHFGMGANKLLKWGTHKQLHYRFPQECDFSGREELGKLANLYYINTFDEERWASYESGRSRWLQKQKI